MDRRARILSGLRLEGLGLEIGASYCPVAAGDPALRVKTLDHLDQKALVEKYLPSGVDTGRIQPVDFVWSGERYADLIGGTRFDWVLASHVVEHVPDIIGFVNECAEILTPDGILSLVVPDRRWEFDFYRPPSGLGSVVDAHLQGRRLSSPGLAAEFGLYMAQLGELDTWNERERGTPNLRNEDWVASSLLKRARAGEYVDIHAWVFTAHSFRLLVEDLHALGLLKLRETAFHAANEYEFYIQLSTDGAGPGLTRQELCIRALEEAGPPTEVSVETESAAALEALSAEIGRLRDEVNAFSRSNSWRITAPLRALRRLGASRQGVATS